jgi:hypothetical protein
LFGRGENNGQRKIIFGLTVKASLIFGKRFTILKTVNHFSKLNPSSLHAHLISNCPNPAMVGSQNTSQAENPATSGHRNTAGAGIWAP